MEVVKLQLTYFDRKELEWLVGRYEVLGWIKEGLVTTEGKNYSQTIVMKRKYIKLVA